MIKKTILLAILLLALATTANGDKIPVIEPTIGENTYILIGYPDRLDGGVVEIDCEFDSLEAEIGGEFSFDIILTNLTDYEVKVIGIYSGILKENILSYFELNGYVYEGEIAIEPHQAVKVEVEGTVSNSHYNNGYWYKQDDKFYYDFDLSVDVKVPGVVGGEHVYRYIYQNDVSVEVTNIYNGSKYMEYEWAEDRQTMYFYDQAAESITFDKDEYVIEEYTAKRGTVYYDIHCRNISGRSIDFMTIHNNTSYHRDYNLFIGDSVLPEKVEMAYHFQFKLDEKYYGVEAVREYRTEYLSRPKILIEVTEKEDEDSEYNNNYDIVITNIGDAPIEDFFAITTYELPIYDESPYMRVGTLGAGEKWHMEAGLKGTIDWSGFRYIRAGYYKEGMLYWWPLSDYVEEDEKETYELAYRYMVVNNEIFHTEDYGYANNGSHNYYHDLPTQAATSPVPTPEQTETITPSPSAKDLFKEKILEKVDEIETARRRALIVIGVLICGAVAVIVLSMKKVVKDRQNEESDD